MTPAEIFARFGRELVLLKLRAGEKAPIDQGWQRLTLADMTPEYLASLNGNIGVKLGPDAGNLASIDIDVDGEGDQFLMLNPQIADTVISNGARGCNVWLEVGGKMPSRTHKIKTRDGQPWGEWRWAGGQTVISGTHPSGVQYSVKGGPVLKIDFEDIVWPDYLELPWVEKSPYDEDAPEPRERIHARVQAERKSGLITQTPRGEHVNMTYAAQYFTERRRIKYEPGEGSFYLYDPASGAWRCLFEAEVTKLLKEFWTELMEEFNNPFCLVKKDPLTNTLIPDIKGFCVQPEMFKPKEEAIIHCTNGMVHISPDGTTILRPFSWKYFSRNPIPFKFDPNAEAPQFLAFLREALDDDDVSLFIRYMGNVLIGGNRAEKILFLTGEPESGKSTAIKFIQALIGKGNYTQLRIAELAGRFETESFIGKMLLSAYDAPAGILETKEAQMLKMLSGHDEMFAEVKYQTKRLAVSPGYAISVTSNEKLRIRLEGTDDVGAWKRRLMIIEFRKKPVSMRDRNLLERLLKEEGDGILMLAIQGAIAHLQELKEHGSFVQTPRQLARVSQLLEESESVKVFVKTGLEWDEHCPGMTTGEIVSAYMDFCEERDWKNKTPHQVEKMLPELMQEVYREPVNKHFNNDKARGYRHVKVKSL